MADIKMSYTLEDAEIQFDGNVVGGVQNVTVTWEQENKPTYEAGTKKPREIRPGQIGITGTVGRLHLDNTQIKNTIDLKEGNNPSFTIVGVTKNKTPGSTIKIVGAMFKGFSLELALTEDTLLNQDFDALDIIE